MTFGTLQIVKENDEEYFQIDSTYEIELMIKRLIPSHGNYPLQVKVHSENTQIIKMVMGEFPFDIQTDKWDQCLGEIKKREELAENLSTLDYVEPDNTYFIGTLRPFQKLALDFLQKTNGNTLIADEMGLGKSLSMNSKILTPSGWKIMRNIKLHDEVINSMGTVSKVIGVFPQGKLKLYDVIFSDGSKTRCSKDHLWQVNSPLRNIRNCKPKILTLDQIMKLGLTHKNGNRQHFIPIVKPIKFYKKELSVSPYLLGILLGDGCIKNWVQFSTMDKEILDNIQLLLPNGVFIKKKKGDNCDYSITTGKRNGDNKLIKDLRKLELIGKGSYDKFIPTLYLEGSINQRTQLLQGLMDGDGYASKDGYICQYSTSSKQLMADFKFLVQSLGGTIKMGSKIPFYRDEDGNRIYCHEHYVGTINLPNIVSPFMLTRKKELYKPKTKYLPHRSIKAIKYAGLEDAQCISVDSDDKLYVTDDFILTHNTPEALSFIATKPKLMPVVIVAPLVTLINWKREIEKFIKLHRTQNSQHEPFEDDVGTPKIKLIRSGTPENLPIADFYLINYELIGKRIKDILNVKPKIVVYDEIHYIRNDSTKKYDACKVLARSHTIQHRIGLSGTPVYNKGIEIFNICEILKPGIFGDRSEFIRKYCMNWFQNKTTEDGKNALKKILLDTIMIRRKKIDVLHDLPEKIRIKQTLDIDTKMYDSQIKRLVDDITETKKNLESLKDTDKDDGLFVLNNKIRGPSTEERKIAGMAKAPFVVKYITELLENYPDEKFVVFCHHQMVRDVLLEGLSKFKPMKITGGQNDKERQYNIDNFQNGDSKVIICGLRSGSIGINLTSSAYVIFAELDWTPSVHRQAEDRIHRIGQKRQVFAHYLEGAGTFDEVLSNILLEKSVEINGILGDKMEVINNKKALEFLQNKFQKCMVN